MSGKIARAKASRRDFPLRQRHLNYNAPIAAASAVAD
jgi:hypothetical protein